MFSKIINKAVKRMADPMQHSEGNDAATASAAEVAVAIGEQLRAQRKSRGISLIEISEHTKIGKKYLEALEEGRYDLLPCETYIRGFLRAYAKYLELDDQQILRQYKDERRKVTGEREPQKAGEEEGGRSNNQSIWVPLLSLLFLAGVGAGLFLFWPAETGTQEAAKPAEVQPEPTAGAYPPAAAGQANPILSNAVDPAGDITLTVKAKEKTWITLMADGRQEPDVTLNIGEEQTWKAKERFVLWTGNAGGVDVIFNGELQPPLGKAGEVRKEVVFERRAPTGPDNKALVNPMVHPNPVKVQ